MYSIIRVGGIISRASLNIVSIITKATNYCKTAISVLKHYTTGTINNELIKDFIKLKMRIWATNTFGNGDVKFKDKIYSLTYFYGDRQYKVQFPKRYGIKKIVKCETLDGLNVTDNIHQMMGPGNNFHGIPSTPLLLGYDGLIVTYRCKNQRLYRNNEVLKLSYA